MALTGQLLLGHVGPVLALACSSILACRAPLARRVNITPLIGPIRITPVIGPIRCMTVELSPGPHEWSAVYKIFYHYFEPPFVSIYLKGLSISLSVIKQQTGNLIAILCVCISFIRKNWESINISMSML